MNLSSFLPCVFHQKNGQGHFALWAQPDGEVRGYFNGMGRVPVKGLEQVPFQLFQAKIAPLLRENRFRFHWDGTSIRFLPFGRGGGGRQSRHESLWKEGERAPWGQPFTQPKRTQEPENPLFAMGPDAPAALQRRLDLPDTRLAVPALSVWMIPESSIPFVGRESDLRKIGQMLQGDPTVKLNQVLLAGLGGVGKTFLALQYAKRHRNQYPVALVVSADNPSKAYRAFGEKIGIIGLKASNEEVFEKVLGWFETHSGWIIVLDNAEDASKCSLYLPQRGGDAIITSRNPHSANSLVLSTITPSESLELLEKITGQESDSWSQQLVEQLGCLPLGLAQAAGYISETKTSYQDYYQLFLECRGQLWKDEASADKTQATLMTTWKLSEKRLGESAKLLWRTAFIAPEAIPTEIFDFVGATPLLLQKRLHLFQKFSLLAPGTEEGTYETHRLFQATVQESLSTTPALKNEIIAQVWAVFHNDFLFFDSDDPITAWPKAKRLVSHLEAFLPYIKKDLHKFLNKLFAFYSSLELDMAKALKFSQEELQREQEEFGPNSLECTRTIYNIGVFYIQAKKGKESVEWCEKAKDRLDTLHPDITELKEAVLSHLAFAYTLVGNGIKAAQCTHEALVASGKTVSNESTQALTLHQAGQQQLLLGNYKNALEYHQKGLKITEQLAGGKDDHALALSLRCIGAVYCSQKQFSQALAYLERAYQMTKNILPEDHPDIAECSNDVAVCYIGLNQSQKAVPLFKEAVRIYEDKFGPDYGGLGAPYCNLGAVNIETLQLDDALAYTLKGLRIEQKNYGGKNVSVAQTMGRLGVIYTMRGDYQQGQAYTLKALSMLDECLGPNNPESKEILDAIEQLRQLAVLKSLGAILQE